MVYKIKMESKVLVFQYHNLKLLKLAFMKMDSCMVMDLKDFLQICLINLNLGFMIVEEGMGYLSLKTVIRIEFLSIEKGPF